MLEKYKLVVKLMMVYVLIIIGYKYKYNQNVVIYKSVIFGNVISLNMKIKTNIQKMNMMKYLLNIHKNKIFKFR